MSELGKLRYRLIGFLLALGVTVAVGTPAQAQNQFVNWYDWYRDLRGYFSSVGGVLCAPGTELQFYRDGRITATSRDATCLASLDGLHYPLPQNAPVRTLSLTIRQHSAWPMSRRAINDLVRRQTDAMDWQAQKMAKAP